MSWGQLTGRPFQLPKPQSGTGRPRSKAVNDLADPAKTDDDAIIVWALKRAMHNPRATASSGKFTDETRAAHRKLLTRLENMVNARLPVQGTETEGS